MFLLPVKQFTDSLSPLEKNCQVTTPRMIHKGYRSSGLPEMMVKSREEQRFEDGPKIADDGISVAL